jgi:hypothetical protein
MKKNLLFGFLILFLLSTTAFAGLNGPKKDSEKPAVINPKENKLSDEEISRMSRRAEIDNLSKSNVVIKDKNDSRNNLKATNQIVVERRHHGYYYGGAGLILVVIIVILLV